MFRLIKGCVKLGLFAGALAVGGMIAVAVFQEKVEGSGTSATEDRKVGDVTEVELSGIGNLVINQGEMPSLSVTADDNILPHIVTETHGNKLTLYTESGFNLHPKTPITYTLTVPKLAKVGISGAGNVKTEKFVGDALTVKLSGAGNAILNGVDCRTLTLGLSGAGNATMSGTVEAVTAKVSGAGEINAAALKVRTADIQVSGSGDASVWATEHLKVRVSGAGSIKYKGSPQVDQKISGSGSVKPIGG
jgi:hypothetical protein